MGFGDLGDLFKAKKAMDAFLKEHPRFPAFCDAVSAEGVAPGSVIDIRFTSAEGKELETNFLVKESDLELLRLMKDVMESMKQVKR